MCFRKAFYCYRATCKTDDDCYPSEFCDEEKGVCEVSPCKRLNGRIKVYKISNAINDSISIRDTYT